MPSLTSSRPHPPQPSLSLTPTRTLAHLHPPLTEHRHALLHPLCLLQPPALLYFIHYSCNSRALLNPLLSQHTLLYFNPAGLLVRHPLLIHQILLYKHRTCSTSSPALLYFLLILYTMLHFIRCSSNVEYAQPRPLAQLHLCHPTCPAGLLVRYPPIIHKTLLIKHRTYSTSSHALLFHSLIIQHPARSNIALALFKPYSSKILYSSNIPHSPMNLHSSIKPLYYTP